MIEIIVLYNIWKMKIMVFFSQKEVLSALKFVDSKVRQTCKFHKTYMALNLTFNLMTHSESQKSNAPCKLMICQ